MGGSGSTQNETLLLVDKDFYWKCRSYRTIPVPILQWPKGVSCSMVSVRYEDKVEQKFSIFALNPRKNHAGHGHRWGFFVFVEEDHIGEIF
jgi:hypothetical protein